MRKVPYPIPGEILREEFLEPMGISKYRLAQAIHVSPTRIVKSLRVNALLLPTPAFVCRASSASMMASG